MPENKTLTFPPKSEWPTLTDADWASNRRHTFLKFKRLLLSMFTAIDFVVGNQNYGGKPIHLTFLHERERRISRDESEGTRDTRGTHVRKIDTRKGRTRRANIGVD
jgi:hypothetical protein